MAVFPGIIERLAFMVLFAPMVIFLPGWLKPVFSLPLTLSALTAGFLLMRGRRWKGIAHNISAFHWVIIILLVAAWLLLSGAGGMGFQNSDYEKHNAVLYDLADHLYPVVYPEQQHLNSQPDSPLVYCIGYYLIPAFAGKICHAYRISQWVMFLQLFLSVILVMVWIIVHFHMKRFWWAGLLLFILFSGADIWNHILPTNAVPALGAHLEWPPFIFMQYSAVTTQLFWVPQHAVAAWLGAILILGALRDLDLGRGFAVLCLLPLWSPFAALGCIPFCLLFFEKSRLTAIVKDRSGIIRTAGIVPGFLPLAVVVVLFLACRSDTLTASRVFFTWGGYFRTVFFEFGWWMPLLCLAFARMESLEKQLLITAMATLAVIPVMKAPGIYDFIMRVSMPSLFILFLSVGSAMRHVTIQNRFKGGVVAMTMFFVVSSWVTPFYEMTRSIQHYTLKMPSAEGQHRVVLIKPLWAARQYVGNGQGFFFKYLARGKEPHV